MSEAIISRRGYDANGKPELRTEIITGTTNWTVPNSIRNTTISVRIFGGGVYMSNGGGSGWMNNGEITVTPGQKIPITIGSSGGSSGGTTTFGTYLSANGGSLHNGGAGGGSGGRGYQFGGGGGYATIAGGDGGMWGGGGGGGTSSNQNNRAIGNGGNGGTYGGGGGGATACRSGMVIRRGGNGGTYGGGGGSGVVVTHNESTNIRPMTINGIGKNNYSIGGEYGGNGGSVENKQKYDIVNLNQLINDNTRTNPSNGTNTMGNLSIPSNLRGYGRAGSGTTITLKGNDISLTNSRDSMIIPSGGGGGYGGNGGRGVSISDTIEGRIRVVVISGGGGGGYGGDGGRSASDADFYDSTSKVSGGGGGGYGGDGGNGYTMNSSNMNTLFGGGGGGYFSDAWYCGGGGYYNYCHGGGTVDNSSFGYGSGGVSTAKGGACILEYWI